MSHPSLVTVVTGAATTWVQGRLAGPTRSGRVVHAGVDAVYLDDRGSCLALLTRHAVAVPCGVRTILDSLPPVRGHASVGDGRLVVGDLEVRVTRFVDASVPRVESLPELDVSTDELPQTALELLRAGDPTAVSMLLGRGSGLTPLGDDVLCGWLAARIALGQSVEPIGGHVRALAHTTTTLSATLLACALRGEVVPQFAELLSGRAGVEALLAVGHTSGIGLALGLALAGEARDFR